MTLSTLKTKKRSSEEAIIQQRIARTIRMLVLLKSGQIYNTQRLADKFSVSRRTVYRDLRALRDAGVAVQVDRLREAYYVRAQREPGQIPLANDQVVLLALAAHLSPLNSSREFGAKIKSAISELIDGLPQSEQVEAGRLMTHMRGKSPPVGKRVLDEIVRALRGGQVIHVLMETTRGTYANVEIMPDNLVAGKGGWQLLGYVTGGVELQIFKVASFLRVDVGERPKVDPALDSRTMNKARLPRQRFLRKQLRINQKTKAATLAHAG
jgi:predicted DNA-binding transcriptional regulator YafY